MQHRDLLSPSHCRSELLCTTRGCAHPAAPARRRSARPGVRLLGHRRAAPPMGPLRVDPAAGTPDPGQGTPDPRAEVVVTASLAGTAVLTLVEAPWTTREGPAAASLAGTRATGAPLWRRRGGEEAGKGVVAAVRWAPPCRPCGALPHSITSSLPALARGGVAPAALLLTVAVSPMPTYVIAMVPYGKVNRRRAA
jgi:hypothetical protein